MEDMEDLYLAEKTYEDFIDSGEKALTTEEVEKTPPHPVSPYERS
jgi:predicted DNA-binding protein